MNLHEELIRIAETLTDEKDKAIVYSAAMQLAPGPTPQYESTEKIEGWGYITSKVY